MKVVLISDTFFTLFTFKTWISSLDEKPVCHVFSWDERFIEKARELNLFEKVELLPMPQRGIKSFSPFEPNKKKYKQALEKIFQSHNYNKFFTHQIYDLKTNVALQICKRFHPQAEFALLPDGSMNIYKKEMSLSKSRKQKTKALVCKLSGLPYKTFSGDWTGIDSADIEGIYLPKGFPNQYDQNQIKYFQAPERKETTYEGTRGRSAIFLDQVLVEKGCISFSNYKKCLKRIDESFIKMGIDTIYYKAHPKSKSDPTHDLGWKPYVTKKLMDDAVLDEPFSVVASFTSTVLMASVFNSDKRKQFTAFDISDYLIKDHLAFEKEYMNLESLGCSKILI